MSTIILAGWLVILALRSLTKMNACIRLPAIVLHAPILLIELFTIVLLCYISYGEVNIQYPHFVLDKMEAQAETIKTSLDPYLQAAIPLGQFSGFKNHAQTLFKSDADIEALRVVDQDGVLVFAKDSATTTQVFTPLVEDTHSERPVHFFQSEMRYRVVMALNGKFGPMGQIALETSKQAVNRVIDHEFRPIVLWSTIGFVVFTVCVLSFGFLSDTRPALARRQKSIFNGVYFVSFIVIVAMIVLSVFDIYNTGALAKATALADSMAQRISSVIELHLDLQDISGINESLRDYQSHHADISGLALITEDNQVLFHTRTEAIGQLYHIPADSYEYSVKLQNPDQKDLYLSVTIPVKVVRAVIIGQAKQFIALLIACTLMSWVFLEASGARIRQIHDCTQSTFIYTEEVVLDGLKLVKAAYVLIVFTSALPMSFLPHLTKDLAETSGTTYATATLPFTVYYFVFAAILIPAGRYAIGGRLKQMMGFGFIAELVGLLLIATGGGYWLLTLGRIFSGIGQGVFLIGLNSYTITITPKDKATLGNTVKVNGRNAALISGTSIGALLYTYMDYQSLFLVASVINLVGMIYLMRLVPSVERICSLAGMGPDSQTIISKVPSKPSADLFCAMRDPEFLRTLGLVGIIGKIGIAGVVMFAVPLILTERGVPSADIGLALMAFYIASILVTHYASVVVDGHPSTSRLTLFLSALVGGVGMLMMGTTGIDTWHYPDTSLPGLSLIAGCAVQINHWMNADLFPDSGRWLLFIGIVFTGISNGLLSAPIMTHISKTPVARRQGRKAVAAVYLFLERAGHMIGPLVISSLLAFTYNTPLGITLFGIITICLGIVFLITSTPMQQPSRTPITSR